MKKNIIILAGLFPGILFANTQDSTFTKSFDVSYKPGNYSDFEKNNLNDAKLSEHLYGSVSNNFNSIIDKAIHPINKNIGDLNKKIQEIKSQNDRVVQELNTSVNELKSYSEKSTGNQISALNNSTRTSLAKRSNTTEAKEDRYALDVFNRARTSLNNKSNASSNQVYNDVRAYVDGKKVSSFKPQVQLWRGETLNLHGTLSKNLRQFSELTVVCKMGYSSEVGKNEYYYSSKVIPIDSLFNEKKPYLTGYTSAISFPDDRHFIYKGGSIYQLGLMLVAIYGR